jgi:hypothetical protein
MKPIKINLLLAILTASLTVGSCEIFSDEETDKRCKENELKTAVSMDIYVNYNVIRIASSADATHNVLDANSLSFTGKVTKMDCRYKVSENWTIDFTVFPSAVSTGLTSYNFRLKHMFGGLIIDYFPLDFYNDLDYITVSFDMLATFKDGKKFKSTETTSTTNQFKYWASGTTKYTMNMNQTLTWTPVTK